MKHDAVYCSTKVTEIGRSVLTLVSARDLKMQSKILCMLARMPLCEVYLGRLGFELPRPTWIAAKQLDLGRIAREEAEYRELEPVYRMAPQHKVAAVEDLVIWWSQALGIAGQVIGVELGLTGKKAA